MDVSNSRTAEEIEALIIRPHAGRLLRDMIIVQGDCVASMKAGTGSLQETAVKVRNNSVVRDLAIPAAT